MTTFTSYGTVPPHRQAELIRGLHAVNSVQRPEKLEERLARVEAALASGARSPAG